MFHYSCKILYIIICLFIVGVSEYRVGASGPGESGQGDGHATYGRGADVRHAPEAQGQHVALARRDAVGQGPVQVPGLVGGPADGRVADHIPRHGLLPGRGVRNVRSGADRQERRDHVGRCREPNVNRYNIIIIVHCFSSIYIIIIIIVIIISAFPRSNRSHPTQS